MARFNAPVASSKTPNLAGGLSHEQSPELHLVSILLTSFAGDKFYEKSAETILKLRHLIPLCDKKFVAQAAVYARTKFGMRSISHVAASELARHIKGEPWAKEFYNAVIHRPDDMTEIVAYHMKENGKLTNAMKKGLASAFGRFDKYALAKYRGENKGMKLVDLVNLIHPKPTDKNSAAIAALVKGELKSFDTWESELTKAGQIAETEEQKMELKKDAWEGLITGRKIGYFALLRNLRNIILQAPKSVPDAVTMLVDEALIRKSLVLPFRFMTAFDEIAAMGGSSQVRMTITALNKAVDIAVGNVPSFDGETLVVLDVSGSMTGKPAQIGSLFAAALMKKGNADLILFSDQAKYVMPNIVDSVITIANSIRFATGGTNFHSIFKAAQRKYDRVIILSDMQGWIGSDTPHAAFNDYKKRTGADPFVYSFDLNGYGSMQFPERNVFAIAGFSEKVFDTMKLMEQDKQALINEIKAVTF